MGTNFQVLHSQILEWEKIKTLINEKGKPSKTLQLLDFGREKTNDMYQKPKILDLQGSNQQLVLQPRKLSSVCFQGCPDGLKSRWYQMCLNNFKSFKHNTTPSVQMKIIREGKYFFRKRRKRTKISGEGLYFYRTCLFSQPLIPSVVLKTLD